MAEVRKSHPLKDNQAIASDPRHHAWVSASAGTGKTQVLTARVLRLLLNGADPATILCITFTKAGAAEMAERLNGTLARWVRCKDKELRQHLFNLGEPNDDEAIGRARTLFARVLEAPGGLRIETIHAFSQSLLAAFPIESGVAPGFSALDERSTEVLQHRVLADVLLEAERTADPILDDFRAISIRRGDSDRLSQMFGRMIAHASAFEAIRTRDEIAPRVRRMLDLPVDGSVIDLLAAKCGDDAVNGPGLRRFAAALAADKGERAQKRAALLHGWLERDARGRAETLADLCRSFLTAAMEPLAQMATAGMKKADGSIEELGSDLARICQELLDFQARVELAEWLAVTLRAGWQVARAYAAEKERQGVIDYGDMIERAARLLDTEGMGAWVRYKLDQRLDHILIDEAQDTNEAQWTIARRLTEEFFVGQGARGGHRTMFAVGDFKQAIFSFQGTDPREFEKARSWFDNQISESGSRLRDLDLAQSFRSTEAVLDLVNQALAELGHEALGLEREIPGHLTSREGQAGTVMLLAPTLEPGIGGDDDEAEGEEGWASDSERKHAEKLARQIADWLNPADPLWLEAKGRPLKAEDILILVRSRGDLTALLVARLHEERVPVAGVDRLRLTTPLAVQDLLSVIRFALQPEDDLTLATLLVSPLLGWTQDELFELAYGRKQGLWQQLRGREQEGGCFRHALSWLRDVLAMADFAAPYEFLETVVSGPLEGRRRLLARLGEEARDPIDELLNAALTFEAANVPSLQAFLDWIEREDVDVKRDPSTPRDAVRIMTVHGAKGLQAPLVILADATKDPDTRLTDHVLLGLDADAPPLPMHSSRSEARGPVAVAFEAERQRSLQEHWRLCYVALTRAEDILVISGALGKKAGTVVPEQSWHALAGKAMAALGAKALADPVWGEVCIHRSGTPGASARKPRSRPVPQTPPQWAREMPRPEARPPRPLTPSSLGDDSVSAAPLPSAAAEAARRGTLLHALFERLPAVAHDRRPTVAENWLAKPGREPDPRLREELVKAVLGVIDSPALADIFAPDALAEAPIAALVGETVIAGTVDRLLVTDELVRIIDFKTGRYVPEAVENAPLYHLRQMAAYAAALRVIFPGRRVEASLLYTAGPRLLTLSDALVEALRPSASISA